MQNTYDRRQPTYTIPVPLSQPRRSTWKNPWLIGCFSLIAILVLSVSLLYWFAFRPFIALYFPPGNGYINSAVAFSPDGHTLAAAAFKYGPPAQNQETPRLVHIDIWDVSSSIKLRTLAGSDPIAFSPDGRTLATGSQDNHAILLWNVGSGTLLHSFASHNQMSSLVFSPDGHTLASSSQDDQSITLWDAAHGTILHTLSGHTAGIVSLAYSLDGSLLASGSLDHTIKLWDIASDKVLHTLPNPGDPDLGRNPVQFSPDGHTLVSVIYIDVSTTSGGVTGTSHTGHLALWNVSSGTLQSTLSGVEPFAFSPDGHTLASAAQKSNTLVSWDITSGKQQHNFPSGFNNYRTSVAFSPDGHMLVSGSNNGAVEIWDPANGQLLRTLV
jgi:WD40 repeat protein